MQAIILAGGKGTRLKPFTVTIPKPLLPLGDRPIIDIVLTQLRSHGFGRIVISLGYLAPLFQAFVGDGSRWNLEVEYTFEEEPLGTAGALRLVPALDDNFLVLNGDTLTDLNFQNIFEAHCSSGAYATIFGAKVDDYMDYGIVEFDPLTKRLLKYFEKPTRSYYVSAGIYVLSSRIVEFFPERGRLDMPDLLRSATTGGKEVTVFTSEGTYWRDIGRFDHYEAASRDFAEAPERFVKIQGRA